MTRDSVFWIASMTKAITSTAAMQLVEQGKLSLDAPIGKVLPDLASPASAGSASTPTGAPQLRPAKNPITLRHLMTHTAGFCYDTWNGDMVKFLTKTGTPRVATCKNAALKVPIMSDPGTRWEYGTNIDFRRPSGRGRKRQAARRILSRASVHAARHDRHRLQAR